MDAFYQSFDYTLLPQSHYSHDTADSFMFRPTMEEPISPSLYWPTTQSVDYNYYNAPILPEPTFPKLTKNVWEDEETLCYQVEARGIHVVRRQDNDMINGTKLLNVVGMSRGKRDGILKNEKGRVVVKVGSMHLKGVWITFQRAKDLAIKFKIFDLVYPLFMEDPSAFLSPKTPPMGFYWPRHVVPFTKESMDPWYPSETTGQKRKNSSPDTYTTKLIKIDQVK